MKKLKLYILPWFEILVALSCAAGSISAAELGIRYLGLGDDTIVEEELPEEDREEIYTFGEVPES